LRFADDVILMASSAKDLKCMLKDLMAKAGTVGLELHMGKSKILTNEKSSYKKLEVDGCTFELQESTEYLGRLMSFEDAHSVEIKHRIARAWSKFMTNKDVLCSRHYP
jgi:hypothetical protein